MTAGLEMNVVVRTVRTGASAITAGLETKRTVRIGASAITAGLETNVVAIGASTMHSVPATYVLRRGASAITAGIVL